MGADGLAEAAMVAAGIALAQLLDTVVEPVVAVVETDHCICSQPLTFPGIAYVVVVVVVVAAAAAAAAVVVAVVAGTAGDAVGLAVVQSHTALVPLVLAPASVAPASVALASVAPDAPASVAPASVALVVLVVLVDSAGA